MQNLIKILLVFLLITSSQAHARNEYIEFSLVDLVALEAYKSKLGNEVKFYFGNTKGIKVSKTYGEWSSLKQINVLNKTDEYACQWAMMSALISLKKRVLSEGGNAVFVRTNNDHRARSSDTVFECEVGNIVASVAVLGKVVRVVN